MRVSLSHPLARLVSRALKPLGFGIYTLPKKDDVVILVRRGSEISEEKSIECLEKLARLERRNFERDLKALEVEIVDVTSSDIDRQKFTGWAL